MKQRQSPRAGVLALSWVYRRLEIGKALAELRLSEARSQPMNQVGDIAESVCLLQAVGAHYIKDLELIKKDECLSQVLGFEPPTERRTMAFLSALGEPTQGRGFHRIIRHMIRELCDIFPGKPKQVTIDVIVIPQQTATALSWSPRRDEFLPQRIICLWREADLILAGAVCPDERMVRLCVANALRAVVRLRSGLLVRIGAAGFYPNLITSLARRKVLSRGRTFPVGFMAEIPGDDALTLELGATTDGWSNEGLQSTCGYKWRELPNLIIGAVPVSRIALRRPAPSGDRDKYEYVTVLLNRGRKLGDELNRFIRGEQELNQCCYDVDLLWRGADPGRGADATLEGRFRLALLNYNLCTAIRRSVWPREKQTASISRLRERLFHASGSMVKGQRRVSLKLRQIEASIALDRVREVFEFNTRADR